MLHELTLFYIKPNGATVTLISTSEKYIKIYFSLNTDSWKVKIKVPKNENLMAGENFFFDLLHQSHTMKNLANFISSAMLVPNNPLQTEVDADDSCSGNLFKILKIPTRAHTQKYNICASTAF